MTHDPRLATLEEVMNGSPFDIITTPFGVMERWRASTMATGTMGMLKNVYDIVRADAAAQAARADATEARNALIEHLCEKVADFERRFDVHEARLAAAEDARRADQEREAAFNEEPITLPPDLSEYQARTPPSSIADGDEDTHQPSGDLHTLAPKEEPELEEHDRGELEEDDNVGDLPKELAEPPTPVPVPKGSVQPQPISVSLNEG
jgi:hypothetical protein